MIRVIMVTVSAFIMAATSLHAQKFSISTDLLGYAQLGTMNVDASVAVAQKWSVNAGARYNPFTYREGDPETQFQYRQQSYSLGFRYWMWHTWSGWWLGGKARYQEYNSGGLVSAVTEEGDRFGAGVYSGYTLMVASHFNVEFGLGFWAGASIYDRYSCPSCGLTTDSGTKFFLLPDDMMISLVYVF